MLKVVKRSQHFEVNHFWQSSGHQAEDGAWLGCAALGFGYLS